MTKSNNEWVPEVGKVYMAERSTDEYVEAELLRLPFDGFQGYPCGEVNHPHRLFYSFNLSPIKTEAEKRRDLAVEELFQKLYADDSNDIRTVAENIIDAGWIKPKPLTGHAIEEIIKHHQWGSAVSLSVYDISKAIEAYIRGEG